MLEELKSSGIENVMIFVSDAHRFDHLPDVVREMGVTFKMVAASTFTAPSLSSISLGLFPFRHGVKSFRDRIPTDFVTIFDLEGMNSTFNTENTWVNWDFTDIPPIFKMLRRTERISLKDIEAPFIYLEDEKGGHCPYGWHENDEYEEWECKRFYRDYGKRSQKELIKRYDQGINRSVREFKKRLKVLEKRGLLDKTLVIFISDHGELLGEHGGIIGHGTVTTPEIIYVPCVMIHPSLKNGDTFENEGVLSHVDLLPTIIDILDIDVKQEFDGKSILAMKKIPDKRYAYFEHYIKKKYSLGEFFFNMKERSVWAKDGGIVLKDNSGFFKSRIRALYEMVIGQSILSEYTRSRLKNNPVRTISDLFRMTSEFSRKETEFGKTSFTAKEAREMADLIENREIKPEDRTLVKKSISRLKISRDSFSRKI